MAQLNVTATTGNLEVISTGVVHVSDDKPLTLKLNDGEGGAGLEMIFRFEEDNESKEPKLSKEFSEESNKLNWVCKNIFNPLGMGIIQPMEVGTLRNKKIFISFFIWTPTREDKDGKRLINYVVYLEN